MTSSETTYVHVGEGNTLISGTTMKIWKIEVSGIFGNLVS